MYFFHRLYEGACWFQTAELFRFCKAIWAPELFILKMVRAVIYQQEPRIETFKRCIITSSSLPAVGSE